MASRSEASLVSLCVPLLLSAGCNTGRILLGELRGEGSSDGGMEVDDGATTTRGGGSDGGASTNGDHDGGTSTGTTGDPPPHCDMPTAVYDIDQLEGWQSWTVDGPSGPLTPVSAPSSDGAAIECPVIAGAPFENVRCYKEFPDVLEPGAVVLRLRFWYDPPTAFGNVGDPSLVQALEFGVETWGDQRHARLALQWRNVGPVAPGWWIWDSAAEDWVDTNVAAELAAEHWHTLELRGRVTEDGIAYEGFSIDGHTEVLTEAFAAASAQGELDRMSVTVQADVNASGDAYSLVVDRVSLERCTDADCDQPTTWYRDLDSDDHGTDVDAVTACTAPPGYVALAGDCDDDDASMRPGVTPDGGLAFGPTMAGAPLGAMSPGDWDVYVDGRGSMASAAVGGSCGGISLSYDLAEDPEPNWVVIRHELDPLAPVDLGGADFLLVPFAGEAVILPRTVEVKLQDSAGCMTTRVLEETTGLPACRTAVIALEGFSSLGQSSCGPGMPTDLGSITAIELGISEVGASTSAPELGVAGALSVGQLRYATAAELRLPMSSFDCAPTRGDVMGRIARRLVVEQEPSGFIRSWFPQAPGSYNLYTQAIALVVLSLEHERTGDESYSDAATLLADRLVMLQGQGVAPGTWSDIYMGVSPSPAAAEAMGSTARTVVALRTFIDRVAPAEAIPYTIAIADATTFIESHPGMTTLGTIDRVSAYFALRAAGHDPEAGQVAADLLGNAWDPASQWFRMGPEQPGIALEVMCNWGAELLRREGLHGDALASCGLAAGTFPVSSFDGAVLGLGDIAGPWQPSVEFTAQYAHAGGAGAAAVLEQMLALEDPTLSGAFPGATDDFGGGDGWNTSMTGISPSAWVYLALHGPGFLREL